MHDVTNVSTSIEREIFNSNSKTADRCQLHSLLSSGDVLCLPRPCERGRTHGQGLRVLRET